MSRPIVHITILWSGVGKGRHARGQLSIQILVLVHIYYFQVAQNLAAITGKRYMYMRVYKMGQS